MPVTLERPSGAAEAAGDADLSRAAAPGRKPPIRVGLVNNMPDAAMAATERQFTRLLHDASAEYEVRLRLFALRSVPRSPETRRDMQETYHDAKSLRTMGLDALIVTGAEPVAPSLPEEPYWSELVEMFDIAREKMRSTIFSCLAAHAAMLHWHGVPRIRLPRKLSGIFAARVARAHPLVDGFPPDLSIPHSRLNGLDEATLTGEGYATLIRSDEAGVDLVIREEASLLVFLQGHPEYEADSLAREFRRDLCRYLAAERDTPPDPPSHYFSGEPLAEIEALLERARLKRRPDLIDHFPAEKLKETGDPAWRPASQRLYRNWLGIVAEHKMATEPSLEVAR